MKKLLLILFISFAFIGSVNANNKDSILARECLQKISDIDPNRKLLPKKISQYTHTSLSTITKERYCNWWRAFSTDAIYGDRRSCAWRSVEVIRITVNGKNRFNENHESVFDCAYRGMNYELDGIRLVDSGPPLLEILEALRNNNGD